MRQDDWKDRIDKQLGKPQLNEDGTLHSIIYDVGAYQAYNSRKAREEEERVEREYQ